MSCITLMWSKYHDNLQDTFKCLFSKYIVMLELNFCIQWIDIVGVSTKSAREKKMTNFQTPLIIKVYTFMTRNDHLESVEANIESKIYKVSIFWIYSFIEMIVWYTVIITQRAAESSWCLTVHVTLHPHWWTVVRCSAACKT